MSSTDSPGASGSGTPAGWFAAPAGAPGLRYWDGAAWTDNFAPPSAPAAPPIGRSAPPAVQPTITAPPAATPGPSTAPRKGMSGCVWALLVVVALFVLGGIALVALISVGVSHVSHVVQRAAGDAGRPASLPSGEAGYKDSKKQDVVAGSDGEVKLGSIEVTATNWARATAPSSGTKLICGDIAVHRPPAAANTPSEVFQLAGNEAWSLQSPSGGEVALSGENSDNSPIFNALTGVNTGDFSGKVCFPDSGGSGRYVVLWQPDLLNARRAVWLVNPTG